jgi:hypothetical protein
MLPNRLRASASGGTVWSKRRVALFLAAAIAATFFVAHLGLRMFATSGSNSSSNSAVETTTLYREPAVSADLRAMVVIADNIRKNGVRLENALGSIESVLAEHIATVREMRLAQPAPALNRVQAAAESSGNGEAASMAVPSDWRSSALQRAAAASGVMVTHRFVDPFAVSLSSLNEKDRMYFERWRKRKAETDALQFNTPGFTAFSSGQRPVRDQWDLFQPIWDCDSASFVIENAKNNFRADGGKWLCDMHRLPASGCVVYSFGSNRDIKFERGVIQVAPQCEIHIFDPTVKDVPLDLPPQAHYHTLGLGAHNGKIDLGVQFPDCELKTLLSIMRELGHDHIDVLKVDIELSEWAVVHQWALEGLPPIGQLAIELHLGFDHKPPAFPLSDLIFLFDFFESRGFRLFAREPNGWCENCHEYSLVYVDSR